MKALRGDTLVEVLLAITVLSIVIVGAITIMTRGLEAAQIASEHTQVRLSMSAQTEMLRYLRDAYAQDSQSTAGQTWLSLFAGSPGYADTTASIADGACAVTSGKAPFYLSQSAGVVSIVTFDPSQKPTTAATAGKGLWVEATRSNGVTPAYVNFQLRACWSGIGDSPAQQTITVMRLYDPAH